MPKFTATESSVKLAGANDAAHSALRVALDVADALPFDPVSACLQTALNAVTAENCLPGTPERVWDVNGAGSADVEGFSTRHSLLAGETLELKIRVHDEQAASLSVPIYRLGYYGGAGARKVGEALEVDLGAALEQPECEQTEPEAQLVDCGNWDVAARFRLPADLVSGLYFARPTLPTDARNWRADASNVRYDAKHAVPGRDPSLPPEASEQHAYGSGGAFTSPEALVSPRATHIWFVVRDPDDAPRRDLLFQTSDTTWHAYNGYGGYSTYGTFDYPFTHRPWRRPLNLSDPRHDTVRAHKRSYNTPLLTRNYRAVNAPLGSEYPAIRFLESNGYDIHYAGGADMGVRERARSLLRRSRSYVSVGHDEYWSYTQREEIERARSQGGVHLNFWSANEAYWAVRWERSAFEVGAGVDANEPPRTMVCYKDSQSSTRLDPVDWTGTFRDARPINPRGAMPENALSGTLFTVNAQRHDTLVINASRFGLHRAWRGTVVGALAAGGDTSARGNIRQAALMGGLARGDAMGNVLMMQGILGHEWNSDVDNGWRPSGLQTLSETRIHNVQVIMDQGATFDSGSAIHSLVLHHHPLSGALTFSAGTVQWAWGLDGHHDGNEPHRMNVYSIRIARDGRAPEHDVMQLTVNILADQGVLPGTPQPGVLLVDYSLDKEAPHAGVSDVVMQAEHIISIDGWAQDEGGGSVASVEVSWTTNQVMRASPAQMRMPLQRRWHAARLERISMRTRWSLTWGDQKWHHLHGDMPKRGQPMELFIRVADDSGNSKVLEISAPDDVWESVLQKGTCWSGSDCEALP